MMGYAMPQQIVAGVHTRLWARAFVVVDPNDTRCCYYAGGAARRCMFAAIYRQHCEGCSPVYCEPSHIATYASTKVPQTSTSTWCCAVQHSEVGPAAKGDLSAEAPCAFARKTKENFHVLLQH